MALPSFPVFGLTIGGEGIICCARAIAFGGRTGGGSVDCDRGEEVVFAVKLDEFFLGGFLAEASETGGVSRTGDSCGDSSELMSIFDSSSPKTLRALHRISVIVGQFLAAHSTPAPVSGSTAASEMLFINSR